MSLYLPPAKLAAALRAVERVVVPSSGPPCAITLPSGEVLHLSFALEVETDTVEVGGESVMLDAPLKVPVDEVTEEWWDDEPFEENGEWYVALNAIDLFVEVGERYAALSFHATNGDASTILGESRAAQFRLLRVLPDASGLAGAILTDTMVEVRDLAAPDRVLEIDWDWVRADDEEHFLDRLAEQVVRQTGR